MGRTATATRAAAVQCGRIEADQRRLRTRRLRIAFHDRGATAAQQDLGGVDPLWGKNKHDRPILLHQSTCGRGGQSGPAESVGDSAPFWPDDLRVVPKAFTMDQGENIGQAFFRN